MEEKEKKERCCPLCHRQFDTLKEMQNLVDEVRKSRREKIVFVLLVCLGTSVRTRCSSKYFKLY